MTFEFSENTLDKISSDAAIVFAFTDAKKEKGKYIPLTSFTKLDAAVNGQLHNTAQLENFFGKKDEVLKILPQTKIAPTRIFVLGLGEKKDFTITAFREIIGTFSKKMKTRIDSTSIVLPTEEETGIAKEAFIQPLVEGITLGKYIFMKYKKEEKNNRDFATVIIGEQKETPELKKKVELGHLYSTATTLVRDLVNETPTHVTPTYLATLAKDIAKSSQQITCKIYDKKEAEKMGMEAFLGIARAADTPPKFIHLEYTPNKKTKEKLALVGKGITFDSGGINVKPGEHMNDMKMDMAGAAIVFGIFSVIAKLQPDVAVMGLIAATPNLVSPTGIVPGDVVRAMNGKTIEIINTDAEGRVTMADSLSYAVKEGATQIIDFATLTGACMVALGEDIAALFSNNKELAEKVKTAANAEGEKVWELPLEPEYKTLNKSSIADISNLSSTRYGGTITAALFLEEFVDNKPWVHLDIAGVAFSSKGNKLGPQGGTGFGVRTVLKLLHI